MTKPLTKEEKKKRKQQKAASQTVKTVTIPKQEEPNLEVNLCDDCAYDIRECEGIPKFASDVQEELKGAPADRVVQCPGFLPVEKMPTADELAAKPPAASLGEATVGEAELAEPPEGYLVIVCSGGCGQTTEHVGPSEFWEGEVKQVDDSLVPQWTCPQCVAKRARLDRFNQEEDHGNCPACGKPLKRTALNRDVDAVRCVNVRCQSFRHIIRTLVVKG